MIKLSIIVPVYGVEQYIEECIASLLIPERDDYEIIVVNDGTKDRSIDIIHSRFSDSRIRIINQKNQGLSAARNHGIREAHGQYVWMFDGDDWAETEHLSKIIDTLKEEDVLVFSSYYINYIDEAKETVRTETLSAATGLELCSKNHYHAVPFYIYRRQVLLDNTLWFTEGILHEDSLFTPIALPYMSEIQYFHSPVYHYRQRSGSITKNISTKRIQDMIYVVNSLVEHGETCIPKNKKYNWGICVTDVLHNLLKTTIEGADTETKKMVRNFVNGNKKVLQYLIHSNSFNNRMMGILSYLAWGNLSGVYHLLYKIRY